MRNQRLRGDRKGAEREPKRGKNPLKGMGCRGRGTEAQREGDRDWVVVGCRETWGGIRDLEREIGATAGGDRDMAGEGRRDRPTRSNWEGKMMCQETGSRRAGAVDRDGRERLVMTGKRGQKPDGDGVRAGHPTRGRGGSGFGIGETGPPRGNSEERDVGQRGPGKEGARRNVDWGVGGWDDFSPGPSHSPARVPVWRHIPGGAAHPHALL